MRLILACAERGLLSEEAIESIERGSYVGDWFHTSTDTI